MLCYLLLNIYVLVEVTVPNPSEREVREQNKHGQSFKVFFFSGLGAREPKALNNVVNNVCGFSIDCLS